MRGENKQENDTLSDALTEIIDTLKELKRMHQLNLELLEQLGVTCGWLLDNHVNVPNSEHIHSLLVKTQTLLNEIYFPTSSDGFLRRKKSDEDLTAPCFDRFLFAACCLW